MDVEEEEQQILECLLSSEDIGEESDESLDVEINELLRGWTIKKWGVGNFNLFTTSSFMQFCLVRNWR